MKTKKSKSKPRPEAPIDDGGRELPGSLVSIPLTFQEASELQCWLELHRKGASAPERVLARLLAEFIKNPTSQRYAAP